jgi:hypothetical protein
VPPELPPEYPPAAFKIDYPNDGAPRLGRRLYRLALGLAGLAVLAFLTTFLAAAHQAGGEGEAPAARLGQGILVYTALFGAAAVYFLPSLIAGFRRHRNFLAVFLINFFLGFFLLGRFVALIRAVANGPDRRA